MKASNRFSDNDLDKIIDGEKPFGMDDKYYEELYVFADSLRKDGIRKVDIKEVILNEYDIYDKTSFSLLKFLISIIFLSITAGAFWALSYFSTGNHSIFNSLFFLGLGLYLITRKPYFSISVVRKKKLNHENRKQLTSNLGYLSIFIGSVSIVALIFKLSYFSSPLFFLLGIMIIYAYITIFIFTDTSKS